MSINQVFFPNLLRCQYIGCFFVTLSQASYTAKSCNSRWWQWSMMKHCVYWWEYIGGYIGGYWWIYWRILVDILGDIGGYIRGRSVRILFGEWWCSMMTKKKEKPYFIFRGGRNGSQNGEGGWSFVDTKVNDASCFFVGTLQSCHFSAERFLSS